MVRDEQEPPVEARVPADVERPDQILFGLTLRQVVILGGTGLGLWVIWSSTAKLLPLPVFAAIAVPVAALAFAVAVGRRDGIPLDAWLLAAVRHARRPHRLVPADALPAQPPAWVATTNRPAPLPAPLKLPAKGITPEGLIDLGSDGTVALVECTGVNFGLRSTTEQAGLIGGFGRWVNSLDAPVQILVRSQHTDLGLLADQLIETAPSLPHPALETAARAHAAYLDRLAAERELLHRQILIAVRDPRSPAHTAHRAAETVRALAACEVTARVLDASETAAALAGCLSPDLRSRSVRSPSGGPDPIDAAE